VATEPLLQWEEVSTEQQGRGEDERSHAANSKCTLPSLIAAATESAGTIELPSGIKVVVMRTLSQSSRERKERNSRAGGGVEVGLEVCDSTVREIDFPAATSTSIPRASTCSL